MIKTKCGHYFHYDCIYNHLLENIDEENSEYHKTCPLCKSEIKLDSLYSFKLLFMN
jgi:hypothetical protein